MDVKDAVRIAKETLANLFGEEGIEEVGLEEVAFDDSNKTWEITLGFSRTWPKSFPVLDPGAFKRQYKILRVRDSDGYVESVKIRETA